MLVLETKQSGGKQLPPSDLREGMFLEDVSRSRQRKKDFFRYMDVRSLYRAG